MEEMHITRYKCSTCGHVYGSRIEAEICESKPVSQYKGVKIGDVVRITHGDGTGGLATVETTYVIDKEWGHYAWERYWHTVALNAKLNEGWGNRMLTFDSYTTIDGED